MCTDLSQSCPTSSHSPPSSIPSCGQSPGRIMSHTVQGLLMLDVVTWPARDNRATTHHEGHLISHPSHRQTWVLGFPTLVSCYSGLICIIYSPFRLQDHWIHIF